MQLLKVLTFTFFFGLVFLICSCSGQNKTVQSKPSTLIPPIATLDHKIWGIYQDHKGHYWFGSNGKGIYHFDGETLTQYTKKEGLVDNQIRSIQGDHLGNVYIGTPAGISKYDGQTFTTLTPVMASNEWQLNPTDLWFNCNGNALYRYDGEKLHELTVPEQDLKKAFGIDVQGVPFQNMNNSPYAVYGLNKDKAGNLWIGTVSAGAFCYDGKSFLWFGEKELSTLPDGRVPGVRSMLEDKDGYMWLSNFVSKYRVKNNGATYEKLAGIDPTHKLLQDRLPYFNSGLSDKQGNLWMTTYGGGVWKYDGQQLQNFPIQDGVTDALVISIYQDNNGVLWLGTDNLGVFRFNGAQFVRFEPMINGLKEKASTISLHGKPKLLTPKDANEGDNVHCSLEDQAGNLWFGTTGHGIYKYDGNSFTQFTTSDGLYSNTIWSVFEDKTGTIWVGSEAGASYYDGQTFVKKPITRPNGNNLLPTDSQNNATPDRFDVFQIMQDKRGQLWFATVNGVYVYDGQSFTPFLVHNGKRGFRNPNKGNVEQILEDSKGNLWFGGRVNEGVFRYNPFPNQPKKSITHLPLQTLDDHNWAWPVLEDINGHIWFSNWGGLYRYDGHSFTTFTQKDGLCCEFVTRMINDKNGNLWFGCGGENSGICRYDSRLPIAQEKAFTRLTTKDGLVNNAVWSILEDKAGHIWVGTRNNGLSRYDGNNFITFSGKSASVSVSK